jgi:hypothetical protein
MAFSSHNRMRLFADKAQRKTKEHTFPLFSFNRNPRIRTDLHPLFSLTGTHYITLNFYNVNSTGKLEAIEGYIVSYI